MPVPRHEAEGIAVKLREGQGLARCLCCVAIVRVALGLRSVLTGGIQSPRRPPRRPWRGYQAGCPRRARLQRGILVHAERKPPTCRACLLRRLPSGPQLQEHGLPNVLLSFPRPRHTPRGEAPCTGPTRTLRQCHPGATSVPSGAGGWRGCCQPGPFIQPQSPSPLLQRGEGLHGRHGGAHAR